MGGPQSQNAAKYAIIDFGQVADAFGVHRKAHKRGQNPLRVRFPRFKRCKHEQGFRADNGPDTVRVDGKTVILPKIGKIAMAEELRFSGLICEVTVNRTTGTCFAAFCVDDGKQPPPVKAGPVTGVDSGVGITATLPDGEVIQNPKALTVSSKRLRNLNKAAARSQNTHGQANHSNRRGRLYDRSRATHARIINVKNNHHHKATTAIAKSSGRVVVEDLNVAGTTRNYRPAWGIANAGMARLLARLECKCLWYEAEYVKADRWFPSSRLCAYCGWHNGDLELAVRQWYCGDCRALNEHDLDATVNLNQRPGSSFWVSRHGNCVSPAMRVVISKGSINPASAPGTVVRLAQMGQISLGLE